MELSNKYTLPSDWTKYGNKSGNYYGSRVHIVDPKTIYQSDTTPFHEYQQNLLRKEVRDRNNSYMSSQKNYLTNIKLNGVPKPEPQGGFARMPSMSGNVYYGSRIPDLVGGVNVTAYPSTQEGVDYVHKLLKKRAQELDMLRQAHIEEANLPVKKSEELTPYKPEEVNIIDLLLDNIESNFIEGRFHAIKSEDLGKLFTTLTKDGIRIPLEDLKRFHNIVNIIISSADDINADQPKLLLFPYSKYVIMNKVRLLLEVLIGTYGFDLSTRKRYIKDYASIIARNDKPEELRDVERKFESQLSREVPKEKRHDVLKEVKDIGVRERRLKKKLDDEYRTEEFFNELESEPKISQDILDTDKRIEEKKEKLEELRSKRGEGSVRKPRGLLGQGIPIPYKPLKRKAIIQSIIEKDA